MFLLCALSIAGEWRSAKLDVTFASNAITPYSATIPLPLKSPYLKPIALKININDDSATYTVTSETAESVVKSILARFGSILEESEIRDSVHFPSFEPSILSRSNFEWGGANRQRSVMRGLAKLEHKDLGNGKWQITVTSCVCTGVLEVDFQCRVVDPATSRLVVKEVQRALTSFEAREVVDIMDREIQKRMGAAPQRVVL